MTISIGSRLGPYEIVSAPGAGGMGEVYKARDTRLDRIVAIKVLPPQFAADPQFRERFDREARGSGAPRAVSKDRALQDAPRPRVPSVFGRSTTSHVTANGFS